MPKPPHLRRLPDHVADALTPEASRIVADAHTELERSRRDRAARGWAADGGVPPFLAAAEAEASGAAELWRVLPAPGGGASDDRVRALGRSLGLTVEATADALATLQSHELAATVPGRGVVALPPVLD